MTYKTTISAETLQQHQNDPDWIVFDCRFVLGSPEAGRAAYQEGHIPGARFMDMDTDLSASPGPAWPMAIGCCILCNEIPDLQAEQGCG